MIKAAQWLPRAKERIRIDCKEAQRNFEGRQKSMIAVAAIQLYTSVKIQQFVELKLVNFIVCKLYINKANFLNGGQEDNGK